MKTKIIINGKAVDAVLDDEQVKAALEVKHTGLDHPGYDGVIYNLSGSQYTDNARETLNPVEFSDRQLRDNYARAMGIYRRLVEAAAKLNSAPIDKLDTGTFRHFIYWSTSYKKLCCGGSTVACDTAIIFETDEAAKKAIDIVGRDDLIWLFRDFQPYIGAYKTED